MKIAAWLLLALALSTVATAEGQTVKKATPKAAPAKAQAPAPVAAATPYSTAPQVDALAARFTPTSLRSDLTGLSGGDREALARVIDAARIMNDLYLDQLWSGNRALHQRLLQDQTALGRARQHFFWINRGPWDELNEYRSFLPGVPPRKLAGANFYPEDMTKGEFEAWVRTLPAAQHALATSFYTVIQRGAGGKLLAIPYSDAYRPSLERAARLLKSAATATTSPSLRRFLNLRADAFLSNDYYASEIAWMDIDAPLDVTIGPYETYNDELFGYKAAFGAFIGVRDERETQRLAIFSNHLQLIENNLPIEPRFRNPKLGASAPIRVIDELFCAGDAAHGVQTAAFNLPNDERVVREKGAKRVMLKNVQEAKFRSVLVPMARRVLGPKAAADVSFEMFFTHILAHELTHGLGPHEITVGGRRTNPRLELKDLYSAIEEAKADVTGLFALQYLMDHAASLRLERVLPSDEAAQRQLYVTYLASAFRTLRFGLNDAHGKGMALQFNFFIDRGAFFERPDGTFAVNVPKMKTAVRDLTRQLLMLEATGDYEGARRLLISLAVVRPNLRRTLSKLNDLPTDIEPIFTAADKASTTEARQTPVTKKVVR